MPTRRQFLLYGAGTMMLTCVPAFAQSTNKQIPISAQGIADVFGDGLKFTGIVLEYSQPVNAEQLNIRQFNVQDRKILSYFVSDQPNGTAQAQGKFVILTLNPNEDNASLVQKKPPLTANKPQKTGNKGPGNAGDKQANGPELKPFKTKVTVDGQTLFVNSGEKRIVDDFKQSEFNDPTTNKTLRYNLFVPKNYDPQQAYPLVLFMHDAGVTGDNPLSTLIQGTGAVCWASPQDQLEHPSFVLAPQFDEIIADDSSHTSAMLDTTIHLIQSLCQQYNIDTHRLYTTGQSGGGMMSIAMDIKYPDFFAASYLVACQWDASLVAPMHKQKLWITVSEDDSKAFPGQTAIVNELEKSGAKVARATWNAQWSAQQYQQAFDELMAQKADVNFVVFEKGSVFTNQTESQNAGGGHTFTWRYAYNIPQIRQWIFAQHK